MQTGYQYNMHFDYVYPTDHYLNDREIFTKASDEIMNRGDYLSPATAFECLSILDDSGKYTFTKKAFEQAKIYDDHNPPKPRVRLTAK